MKGLTVNASPFITKSKLGEPMKKKIINTALAVLIISLSASINAGAGGSVVSCCAGQGIVVTGSCTCYATGGSIRARGDVVKLDLTGLKTTQLDTKKGTVGSIAVPNCGSMAVYQYGDIKIIFASFYLQNQDLNPKVSPAMQNIINKAAQKYDWAKTMIWVGRLLPNETTLTEIMESYTDIADLTRTDKITYEAINNKTAKFTIPASKNGPAQELTLDFNPIKK